MRKFEGERRQSLLAGALCALALGLTPIGASANGLPELCIGQASGVPGPQPKTPEWWNPSLTPSQRETRWTGATSVYDEGSVTPSLASGRAIWDAPSERMFFEFVINADPEIHPDDDMLVMVVSDPTGTIPGLYMQFQPLLSCDPDNPSDNCWGLGEPIPASQIKYSLANDTGADIEWNPAEPAAGNPSTEWTVEHPWIELRKIGENFRWTVKFALEVPTDTESGQAWPNLKLYASGIMVVPSGTGPFAVQFPLMCSPTPGTNDCLTVSSGELEPLPESVPLVSLWSDVTTGDLDACDGVDLMRSLSGSSYKATSGLIPGTSIPYELPSDQIPKFIGAHMRAGFHNDTDTTLALGDIDATFRISDWGLVWDDWDDAGWPVIGTASLDAPVTGGGYSGAFGQGELESALWIPPSTILNDYQALHIRLTTTEPDIYFKRDSVYRAMDLVQVPVFRRAVNINMAHRPLPAGQTANRLFLLRHTQNMPSVQDCIDAGQNLFGCANGGSMQLAGTGGKRKVAIAQVGQALPAPQPLEVEPGQSLAANDSGPAAAPSPQPLPNNEPVPAEAELVEFAPIDPGVSLEELPNYSMYAFVDTGLAINLPTTSQVPIYRYFSSFGYHVEKKGAPGSGFEHFVHIPGAVEDPLVEGGYHLDVGQDEIVSISSTVRVVHGVYQPCNPAPGVTETLTQQELDALMAMHAAQGEQGTLQNIKQDDPQFGCQPPPLREPCLTGDCAPHHPLSYINRARYVGQWTNDAIQVIGEAQQVEFLRAQLDDPDGLAAAPGGELDEGFDDDGELADLPEGMEDACCAQASIDPQAKRRGAAKVGMMAMMLLLLRRGRRRRRRRRRG